MLNLREVDVVSDKDVVLVFAIICIMKLTRLNQRTNRASRFTLIIAKINSHIYFCKKCIEDEND